MQTSFLGYRNIQTIGLLEEKITKAGQYTSLRYFIVFLQSSWGENKELVKYIAVLGKHWRNMQAKFSFSPERKKETLLLAPHNSHTHTFRLTGIIWKLLISTIYLHYIQNLNF
jgi:hypothetical protein